jgi:hypothetical protein
VHEGLRDHRECVAAEICGRRMASIGKYVALKPAFLVVTAGRLRAIAQPSMAAAGSHMVARGPIGCTSGALAT